MRPTSQMTTRRSWRSIARSAPSASSGTNPTGARRPCVVSGATAPPAAPPKAARPLISNDVALDQNSQPGHWARSSTTSTGGESASSSRTAITRSVLRPRWIVWPGLPLGAALLSDDGSAGLPPSVSNLNRNPAIRFSLPLSAGAEQQGEHMDTSVVSSSVPVSPPGPSAKSGLAAPAVLRRGVGAAHPSISRGRGRSSRRPRRFRPLAKRADLPQSRGFGRNSERGRGRRASLSARRIYARSPKRGRPPPGAGRGQSGFLQAFPLARPKSTATTGARPGISRKPT